MSGRRDAVVPPAGSPVAEAVERARAEAASRLETSDSATSDNGRQSMSGSDKDLLPGAHAEIGTPQAQNQAADVENPPAAFSAQMLSGPEWQPENDSADTKDPDVVPDRPAALEREQRENAAVAVAAQSESLPDAASGRSPGTADSAGRYRAGSSAALRASCLAAGRRG